MIIIETCPKCGHDLHDEIICTYPPIPRKVCYSCGWSWEGQREEIVRVPFGGYNSNTVEYLNYTDLSDHAFTDITSPFLKNSFEHPACVNCSNNPKNGGSGICFCTLGQQTIY